MANFSRSLKPTSLFPTMAGRRPGLHGRSMSNTSVSSPASSPSYDVNTEQDGFFSPTRSPTRLEIPRSPQTEPARRASDVHVKPPDSPRSARSRPIAIEHPTARRIATSSSVSTPPAPLSARGDLPGGYFPMHEDQNRVYRSHPFHRDILKARQQSIQSASESCVSEPQAPISAPVLAVGASTPSAPVPSLDMPERSQEAPRANASSANSSDAMSTTTPVLGYVPSGHASGHLPMGKYYPSNYERRKAQKREQQDQPTRPSPSGSSPISGAKSESQVPAYRGESSLGYPRNESEAKKRLQQYQRDMIAQATLALNAGNVNTAALSAISLRNMGFNTLVTKPSKPRLAPLGSPGPVTPMELESSDDGYLSVHMAGSGEAAQTEEIARAIRAEEERLRREGATSPAVETASTF